VAAAAMVLFLFVPRRTGRRNFVPHEHHHEQHHHEHHHDVHHFVHDDHGSGFDDDDVVDDHDDCRRLNDNFHDSRGLNERSNGRGIVERFLCDHCECLIRATGVDGCQEAAAVAHPRGWPAGHRRHARSSAPDPAGDEADEQPRSLSPGPRLGARRDALR
jgi:hypothetical protein